MNSAPNRQIVLFSHLDAVFFSIMIGLGETYFVPLALENQVSVQHSGLVATLPSLFGGIFQFILFRMKPNLESPKRILSFLIPLQIVSLIVIAIFSQYFTGDKLFYSLIGFASIYWFCTFVAGPVWNIWITDILDSKKVSSFFCDRLRFSQVSLFISFTVAGLCLNAKFWPTNVVFGIMFLFAGLARGVSGFFLSRLPDVYDAKRLHEVDPLLALEPKARPKGSEKFILFVGLLYTSVWISAPFFTGFMLNHIKLSYFEFVLVTGSLVAARFLWSPFVNRLLEKFGTQKLMLLGTFLIATLPVLWLVSESIFYLCILQTVGGLGWSILELSINIHIIQEWASESRSRILSWYNLIMAISMTAGSLIGAAILNFKPDSFEFLFTTSSVLRFLPILAISYIHFKPVGKIKLRERLVAIRAGSGPISKPILIQEDEETGEKSK